MTSKEKANDLVDKYLKTGMIIRQAKQCALICVDEQLKLIKSWLNVVSHRNTLLEIKKEIEKL